MKNLTDAEVVKALEICTDKLTISCPNDCPFYDECDNDICSLERHALELIKRKDAKIEKLERELVSADEVIGFREAEIERLKEERDEMHRDVITAEEYAWNLRTKLKTAKIDAYKEFAEKITEVFMQYAHLHSYADSAKKDWLEAADGAVIEMQSVWDVLTLKENEMAEYDEMNRLQTNIEFIEKERLLTELEKDFRLLVKALTEGGNEDGMDKR